MFSFIARLIGQGAAGWIKSAAWPMAIVALVTLGHQYIKARQEADDLRITKAENRGRNQCISEVELATARAEATYARQQASAAIAQADEAQKITAEITQNAQAVTDELANLKSTVAAADANRCLSDSVLQLVRSGNAGGSQKGSSSSAGQGKGGGGAGSAPAGKTP